ncbi:hypothetical protein Pcinc_014864 [Petrolisthes cinctipes]|uniref:Uncharacterized protein n=1 Tax=Petrolisthes cinctipes TaxID=88211 RepID=A0AAE1FUC5_PETCI|nr:hypothetical protein Pcinc_014864 [Petrolisthes cinctipes]
MQGICGACRSSLIRHYVSQVYQCEAVNSVGSAVKRCQVEVTEASVIAGGGEEVDGVGVRLSGCVSWCGQTVMLIGTRKEHTACFTCLTTTLNTMTSRCCNHLSWWRV